MTFCGVEVGVARDDHTWLHEVAKQHVLCCAALVCRDNIFKTSEFGDSVFHVIE